MKVVLDIEANSLRNPTKIWLACCLDIDTGKVYIFRNLHEDSSSFKEFARSVSHWVGHNCLGYDFPVLASVIQFPIPDVNSITDTLILSKLLDYSRGVGHSLESYGQEFNYPKLNNSATSFFSQWSQGLEDYCVRDCEVCRRIYNKYSRIINDPSWSKAILLEHRFQLVVNSLHTNGFAFNSDRANNLLSEVTTTLETLDKDILEQFPPKLRLVREVTPRLTKHGTLDRKDFRWIKDGNLSDYNGGPFCKCTWSDFNPSSHKQIIQILGQSGWKPVDRTKTHIDCDREVNRLKYSHNTTKGLQLKDLHAKLEILKKSGWKVNENNLNTLPSTAPAPARTLARRILYESRRRTLTEWLSLVTESSRIHGKFVGIGAWTHRMAHQEPNTANIPNAAKEDGSVKLLGKELRSLWRAPKNRLLVGVDAEGIQFRIFAHYVNDKELTQALVSGRKADKTDPHSLNASIIGFGCSRQQAKRFIYALLLGGGIGKLAEILGLTIEEAKEALARILKRYPGFDYLRREVIPSDAQRGYFVGLDGRKVRIPGDTVGERRHLCMSGYLQNGEAIIMKMACLKWEKDLETLESMLVNFVHDEWQIETPNNMEIALRVAKISADSLTEVGEELKLNCPMAGSYYNEDNRDYTIGTNWYQTH